MGMPIKPRCAQPVTRRRWLKMMAIVAISATAGTLLVRDELPQAWQSGAGDPELHQAMVRDFCKGSSGLVFLSLEGKDPNQQLWSSLQDLHGQIRPVSASNLHDHSAPLAGGIRERKTSRTGILLNIGATVNKGSESAQIRFGRDSCTGTGGCYGTCELLNIRGSWSVQSWKAERYS